ncbi:ornithine cyclodeaminase family protein [uncultured Tenacibaculum sp.]|uniref:ornithine cyclodeaminase family protein n=1 Tax=uncultured Tenacibaculum sp. TaxID=174713 RepID=UPI002602D5EF|nr:ornithine cyclodeaminase family protein [uncultured Tenacibaculum sp.]
MMIFRNNEQVSQLISMQECIGVMKSLFMLDTSVDIVNPLRSKMIVEKNKIFGMMPAYIRPYNVMGVKVLSVFSENYKKGLSSHQGILHLFETITGKLLMSLEADEVTAIRTAAVSALMTDLLAVNDSKKLCVLGSGKQAEKHLEAILLVRDIEEVFIWSRNRNNASKVIKKVSKENRSVSFQVVNSVKEAVKSADIICTVTASNTPILEQSWLKKGTHINAVGACTPNSRELKSAIILNADVFVDNYESAINESGDLLIPAKENNIPVRDIIKANINEILHDTTIINKSKTTVFNSLGLGIEDLAVANFCYKKIKKAL